MYFVLFYYFELLTMDENVIKKVLITIFIAISIVCADEANNKIDYAGKIKEYSNKAYTFRYLDRDSMDCYSKLAIQTAKDSKDKISIRDIYYYMGYIYANAGYLDSAETLLIYSLRLSEELEDLNGIGKAKNQLGHLSWLISNHMDAKKYFEEAIEIQRNLNNYRELGKAQNNLANMHTRWGDYNIAINLYMQALDSYVESDFTEGVAWLHFSMGILYKRIGEYDQSLKYVQNSLKIYSQIASKTNDSTGIRLCYSQLGYLFTHHLDSLELGLYYQLEALRLAEKIEVKIVIADAFGGVGQTYYKMEKLDLAEKYLQRSYEFRLEKNMKSGTASNLKFLGYIEKDRGNYQKAEDYYDRALIIAKELKYKNIINDLNIAYSKLFELQNQHDKALKYMQQYVALKDSILSTEIANKVASTHLKYEIDKKTRENDILAQQNKIQELLIGRVRLVRNFMIIMFVLALFAIVFTFFLYLKQKQIKTLKGLIPICANCKNIRNDKGYYEKLEKYISDHTEADFSHGMCPDCIRKLEPELYEIMRENGSID